MAAIRDSHDVTKKKEGTNKLPLQLPYSSSEFFVIHYRLGIERFMNGFLDLLTILFMSRFGKKPMQFFGLLGTLFFLIGSLSSVYLIIAKIVTIDFALTNRPSFYIALTTMIIGMQLFLTGFVAEMIARNATERNTYLIEHKLGVE